MAAATDKARFYLEQYVPELQEYERKGLFTRDEITSITAKRSTFEHILNARGSTPGDYARYATYEINLDSLRNRRCKRHGVKMARTFDGRRTVFFILDRATKKFPGDLGLWMQYIKYCQKEKASKKLAKVFTSVLRLHPREWSLWILAAKHYAETQGDMGTARSYMQRGLRFCQDEPRHYLEYAKLEMVHLAKIGARRKILGLDKPQDAKQVEEDDNMISLPVLTAEDLNPDLTKGLEEIDANALEKMASAPAFTGAIPVAIFDAAMKQVKRQPAVLAESFFNLVASFETLPATQRILQHILAQLSANPSGAVEAAICDARLQLSAAHGDDASLPTALGKALASIKKASATLSEKDQARLAEKSVVLFLSLLGSAEDVDEDVVKVLEASIKRYHRTVCNTQNGKTTPGGTDPIEKLRGEGRDDYANVLARITAGA